MKKLQTPLLLLLSLLFIISCGDTPENPIVEITVNVNNFTASVDENVAAGTSLGTVSGSTNEGSVSYSLSNQNPSGALAINTSSGEITVADAAAFDFETNEQITATVTASNSGVTKDGSVTININDLDEGSSGVVWSGATMTFTKGAGGDPTEEGNQDRITDNVWITRGNDGGQFFNIKVESAANQSASPADTEWAIGELDDIDNLTFKPFRETVDKPKDSVGTDLVMHLITDNIYLSVKITAWDQSKTGGFAYERSTE